MPKKRRDLTQENFENFTVKAFKESQGGHYYWDCLCHHCGDTFAARADSITKNKATCPCQRNRHSVTHGMTGTKLYRTWHGIKDRCLNENSKDYPRYGGRGIQISPCWVDDFEAFAAAVGEPPSDAHTIDRIDPNGHYAPGNVRWLDNAAQQNNKTNNRVICVGDECHTVAEWSRIRGFGRMTILNRLNSGWKEQDAVTRPLYAR